MRTVVRVDLFLRLAEEFAHGVAPKFVPFLDRGAAQVTTTFNIDSSFPSMVIGIVLFFVIGCEFFIGYQLKLKSCEEKTSVSAPTVSEQTKKEGENEQ